MWIEKNSPNLRLGFVLKMFLIFDKISASCAYELCPYSKKKSVYELIYWFRWRTNEQKRTKGILLVGLVRWKLYCAGPRALPRKDSPVEIIFHDTSSTKSMNFILFYALLLLLLLLYFRLNVASTYGVTVSNVQDVFSYCSFVIYDLILILYEKGHL